jgi:hypothetical protein
VADVVPHLGLPVREPFRWPPLKEYNFPLGPGSPVPALLGPIWDAWGPWPRPGGGIQNLEVPASRYVEGNLYSSTIQQKIKVGPRSSAVPCKPTNLLGAGVDPTGNNSESKDMFGSLINASRQGTGPPKRSGPKGVRAGGASTANSRPTKSSEVQQTTTTLENTTLSIQAEP